MVAKTTEIDLAECERLLKKTPVGRVGFDFAGKPMVLPVNYRLFNGDIVFRTTLGRKLQRVASDYPVAFEVDSWDETSETGWSVLISGSASEIEEWDEFRKVELLGLEPWAEAEEKERWVRIIPTKITGRRIA